MNPSQLSAKSIRQSFLDFFKAKEHQIVRSAPVTSNEDPTLMFTNAGMNQFKAIFLGENKLGLKRAANSQKCIRVSGKHNDLEEVGKDTYHHTFFEMLGNWSFADYYKKEAIVWAWELLTEVWKLPKERLFVTVYKDDHEAEKLWSSETDIETHRILRFGDKDNFWEMGETGPCGPCSEIHFDTGDLKSQQETFADKVKGVNGENHRYIEIWNLVFIQYNRMQDKSLSPLKEKHVDTGMGFERICSLLQNSGSNYETDVFKPVIDKIAKISGVKYHKDEKGIPHRVIADHIRTLTFAISDGANPSNEGRGYVLRRILRRASRFARELGQKKPILCDLVNTVVKEMGEAFPEIAEREKFVTQVIQSEEESFIRTLDQGLSRFKKISTQLKSDKKRVISGKDAFTLYDTYGFPLDLTMVLAEEKGFSVDKDEYDVCMKEQNERARSAAKFDNKLANDENWTILSPETQSEFTGYDNLEDEGKVLRVREEGEKIFVILDKTSFYAEAGGQVGDLGELSNNKVTVKVDNTIGLHEMIVHIGKLSQGTFSELKHASSLRCYVDKANRDATFRNHSATHLLQAALQNILGDHIQQQGSRVSAESLRFDFTHHQQVTRDEITQIEKMVNEVIQENSPVSTSVQGFEEAKKAGAMALFGEKYGDTVRVVQMGDFSLELCGGTHASHTGQLGLFKITSEGSISSGVRRIEAVTGKEALKLVQETNAQLYNIGQALKSKPGEEYHNLQEIMDKQKFMEKELSDLRSLKAQLKADTLLSQQKEISNIPYLVTSLGGVDKKELNVLVESIQDKMNQGVAVLTNSTDSNLSIFALVGKSLTSKMQAGNIVKEISAVANGKGGGRPDRAQAGSKHPEKEQEVLKEGEKLIHSLLSAS